MSVKSAQRIPLQPQMLPNVSVIQVFFGEEKTISLKQNKKIAIYSISGFYLDLSTLTCLSCPEGAECLAIVRRTELTLYSVDGYWRDVTSPKPTFYPCPLSVNACPSSLNGTCNQGYDGVMCSLCKPGFHMTSNSCTGKAVHNTIDSQAKLPPF